MTSSLSLGSACTGTVASCLNLLPVSEQNQRFCKRLPQRAVHDGIVPIEEGGELGDEFLRPLWITGSHLRDKW